MKRKGVEKMVIPVVVLAAVVSISYLQASSQTAQPPLLSRQSEVAELKGQIAALERRIDTLEERLAEVYKPKMWPLPLVNEGQEGTDTEQSRPRNKNP